MQHILISPLALNSTEQKILTVATDLLVNEGLDCIVLENDDLRGQIVVIDTENDQQQTMSKQIREGQIKILLSSTFYSDKNIISLAKPVSVKTLKELIYKISTKLNGKTNNTHRNALNTASETLFHILLNTKRQKKLIKIRCSQQPDLYINGYNNTISSTAKHSEIDNILTTNLDKCVISDIPKNEYNILTRRLNLFSLDGKLWFTGITESNGVLLAGHDFNKPFKLKNWPNFTRNSYKEEHLKLATILIRQSSTISELEALTNIPSSEIINFYNAAYSVNLINSSQDYNHIPITQDQLPPIARNLLHRMVERLHLS